MVEKASETLEKLAPAKRPAKHEVTSDHIRHLAGRGLHDPHALTEKEVRELCGSVLAHIARHET